MGAPARVAAQPIYAWIRTEVVPEYGSLMNLCRVLGDRTGIQDKSWHRWFVRLGKAETINVYALDRLCTLLRIHLSNFDHIYWVPAESSGEVI